MTEPAAPESHTATGDPPPDGNAIGTPTARKLADDRSLLKRVACVVQRGLAVFVIAWDTLVLRAWIAVLVTAILAVLFVWADQTSDLLLGMMYDIEFAQAGVQSGESEWAGLSRYLAFWIASVSLIAVLGLAARITGAPRDQLSGSNADEEILGPIRLCAWFIVVVSTLIVHSSALQALGHVPIEPYLVAILVLICCGIRWAAAKQFKGKAVLLWSLSIATAAFCAWFVSDESTNGALRATLFVRWTEWTTIAIVVLAALFARSKQIASRPGALLFLLWILLALIVYAGPMQLPQQIGSLAAALSHIAFITASVAGLIYVARRSIFAVSRPDIAVVLALAALIWWWAGSSEKIGREQLTAQPMATSTVKQVSDTNTLAYAIHADGGGLRAALFTATILSLADDLTCGRFGTHVYAASGVSGGALGIATWAMLRQELMNAQDNAASAWSECKAVDIPTRMKWRRLLPPGQWINIPSPLMKLVYGTLVRDHLAAPLTAMLTPDLTFSRDARRGQVLVDSWQSAALQTIRARLANRRSPEAYAINLGRLDAGLTVRPKLIFTATDADSGDRTVMSNIEWGRYAASANMPLGVAALNSARFPIVSPPGAIHTSDGWKRVVDGGFYDNSGAASLREVLIAASGHESEAMPPHLETLRIDGNPLDELDPRCDKFADLLFKRGYTLARPIWNYGPTARATKPTVSATASAPSFNGLSSPSAFWKARSARSREAVQSLTELPHIATTPLAPFSENPLTMLKKSCIAHLPKAANADDETLQCVDRNEAICIASANARYGPLGWYVSKAAALDIMNLAYEVLIDSPFLRDQL